MRIVRRVSGAAVILFMLTGCAVGTHTVAANSPTPIGKISNGSPSPKQICQGSFNSAVLLDWASGTVTEFRRYQYGGPFVTSPLAHAFAGMPGTTRGAWCGTKEGTDATHWWAVIVDHEPATVITVHGPGEGVRHGLVTAPPYVPVRAP